MQGPGTMNALKFVFSDSILLVSLLKLSKPDKGQCGVNMLISLRSTKGIYPSAPVVNKNHCQKKMDADAFSQLLQLQFFQFAQVAEQFLVKSVTQPFSISKTEK